MNTLASQWRRVVSYHLGAFLRLFEQLTFCVPEIFSNGVFMFKWSLSSFHLSPFYIFHSIYSTLLEIMFAASPWQVCAGSVCRLQQMNRERANHKGSTLSSSWIGRRSVSFHVALDFVPKLCKLSVFVRGKSLHMFCADHTRLSKLSITTGKVPS